MQPDTTPEATGRQVDLAFRLAETRRLLRDVRADSRRVLARLVAAENVAALAREHRDACWATWDEKLSDAIADWEYATGFNPPAPADEVEEASLEMRSER